MQCKLLKSFILFILAINFMTVFQVIWYHDEQPVKESSDFQLLFQGDRCSLVIHEAFFDDAGTYKVVAINSGGEASSQCALTVTRMYFFGSHV
jgi:hypothetical protein